jgi:hypothetical protein
VGSVLLRVGDVADAGRAELLPAVAVAGLPRRDAAIAGALGLDVAQFGPTRGGAIQADLDVPHGFWRVWPARGIGLWISRVPHQRPPLARIAHPANLDLVQTLLRLGDRGIWIYEGRLFDDNSGWGRPQQLKELFDVLARDQQRILAIAGSWGDSAGRSHDAVLTCAGEMRAVNPTQAVGWLSIACGLPDE